MEKSQVENDLLALIYETANDPGFWPLLLEGLNKEFESLRKPDSNGPDSASDPEHGVLNIFSGSNADRSENNPTTTVSDTLLPSIDTSSSTWLAINDREQETIARLIPHFHQALQLNRHFMGLQAAREVATTMLDQVPIGIIIVNRNGDILLANKSARDILNDKSGLSEADNRLKAANDSLTQQLQQHIRDAAHCALHNIDPDRLTVLSLTHPAVPLAQSVLITPYRLESSLLEQEKGCAALIIAAPGQQYRVSDKALMTLFGLTQAEARLAHSIADGNSVREFSEQYRVSDNTIRTQLKSIYTKTDTHRQSELVKLILTCPAIFTSRHCKKPNRAEAASDARDDGPGKINEDTIALRDGRKLGFAEFGDPHGRPVFLFHGTYGCRLQRHPDDRLTARLGVRLIVPDRPGFGMSDAHTGRSLLSWVDDCAQLADTLALEKFALVGHDAGGCYAAACAYKIPQRLTNVILVNSLAPFETLKEYKGTMPNEKLFYALAHYTPSLFVRFSELTLKGLFNNNDFYFDRVPDYLGEKDRAIFNRRAISQNLRQMIKESVRGGVSGFAQDMVLIAGGWDFDPANIDIRVHVWHGKQNKHVPFAMGVRLAATIPHAHPRFFDDEGHFIIYNRWEEVMAMALYGVNDTAFDTEPRHHQGAS